MNTNSRFWGARILLVALAMLFGLQHMLTGGMPIANATSTPTQEATSTASGKTVTTLVQKLLIQRSETPSGETLLDISPLVGPFMADIQEAVTEADLPAVLQSLAKTEAPAKADGGDRQYAVSVLPSAMKPTSGALGVGTHDVVHVIDGAGGGQDAPPVVAGDTTQVRVPYSAEIVNFGKSTDEGAAQAVANASANPQPVNKFKGFSEGGSVASKAAAIDGQASAVEVYGSPTTPNTGFTEVMPNLPIVNQGVSPPLQPEDQADYYVMSGDCWANMPRTLLGVLKCPFTTIPTHYGNPGYGAFQEDEVVQVAPNSRVHIDYTEDGFVLAARMVNPNLPEDQAQFLRNIEPQGKPGVAQGPTLQDIVQDPIGTVVDMVSDAIPAVADITPQAETIPQAQAIPLVTDAAPQDQFQAYVDQGTQMIEDFANGTGNPDVQAFVDNTVNTVNQVVDSFTAPAVTAPVQDAAPAPAFTAPVGDLGDLGQQITNTVNQFTGGNTGIDLGAIANGLFAGAH